MLRSMSLLGEVGRTVRGEKHKLTGVRLLEREGEVRRGKEDWPKLVGRPMWKEVWILVSYELISVKRKRWLK